VSENDNCLHCTGTTNVAEKELPEEQESFEETSENRHRGGGRDTLGQTVPNMGSSYRQVADDCV